VINGGTMNWRTSRKVLIGIIGAILLGALGSGFWDIAGRPGVQWAGRAILDVVSLGSEALKNATYREAAKGYHEGAVLELTAVLVGVITGAIVGLVAETLALRVRTARVLGRSPHKGGSALATEPEGHPSTEKRIYLKFRLLYIVDLLLLLVLSTLFIGLLRIVQANEAYTYFSQSLVICRPYMDERHAQLLASRFAGIERRADYIHVVDELRSIAAANHVKLPDFQPW